jgi:signal recognition particle receptor subunit beta
MRAKRNHHKIVFTGPVGAGKTTAIASIRDIEPVRTDASASDMTIKRKNNTTVAMDYGMLRLPAGEKVMLYGTPGQERFDFMWEILTEGGIGLVLLLDNTRVQPLQDMRFFLDAFRDFVARTQVVIGITHSDEKATPSLAEYHSALRAHGIERPVPIFEADARSYDDVSLLVRSLLHSLDPGLDEANA